MKKILITTILLTLPLSVLAVTNINASDYEDFDSTWAGQKVITNQEFETTMDALEERKNKVQEKEKKKKLKKFKGSSLHKELDASFEDLPDQTVKDPQLEEQVILFPADALIHGGKIIEKGYYRAIGEKKDGVVMINLYQSHELKGQIKAQETQDDFGEKDIMFIKLVPHKASIHKLIFGSLEANAFTYVRFIEPSTDFTPQ